MPRGNGGIIGPVNTSFSGVWSLTEAQLRRSANTWPNFYAALLSESATGSDVFSGADAADPYFEYTTLLLPGNGTNGAQNNTFLDSSSNAFTVTRNPATGPNAPTQGTFSPFSQTGWGNYFSGSSQYLSVADSADFDVAAGNFTIEAFVFRGTTGVRTFIYGQGDGSNNANTSVTCEVSATNKLTSYYCVGSAATAVTATNDFPSNSWVHVAIVRNGGNLTQYINGTKDGENTSFGSQTINNSSIIFGIGSLGTYAGLWWNGYISNFRFVKGTAVYTANFTPPTSPLTAISGTSLLTCQSNRFIDTNTQTTAKTITVNGNTSVQAFSPFNPTASWSAATYGGSGYFDGNGDYLSVASNAAFQLGTGDFSIEAWIYPTATPGGQYPVVIRLESGGYNSNGLTLFWRRYNVNPNGVSVDCGGVVSLGGTSTVALNTWTHVAVTRTGTTFALFVNGTREATTTSSNNFSVNDSVYIGDGTSDTEFPGYISNVRIVKGSNVYGVGTTLTVPTAPLTAISGTSLLLNFTNAGIYDATSKNDLETVGNAQISTAIAAKWGSGSMYFDGTGDYLLAPVDANPYYNFGTGDFTVECWFYANSLSATDYAALLGCNNAGAGNNEWAAYVRSNGIFFYGSSGTLTGVAGTINTGTWYHYAASRSGNTLRIFLNGTQTTSATVTGSYTNSAVGLRVGDDPVGSNPAFNGYLQDVRITKGYARYTANFTAPTAAFPTL